MLKLDNVSKRFDTFKLENISFDLPKGYIMGLIGENGSGKTTLINIISGLYKYDKGLICFNGLDLQEEEEKVRQQIGTVIHEEVFDKHFSLINNADRYGRYYNLYERELFVDYASKFNLEITKRYRQLSKGEKLKFSMAFALSHKPRLLLLDEPTANFDKEFRAEFFRVLRDFTNSGECSVILSTHITSDIDMIADYILFLQNGRQLMYGDIESIRKSYRIVAGEEYKIKLLKDRIINMENGEYGSRALVFNRRDIYEKGLKVWEPSIEELMYHIVKGRKRVE